MQRVINFSGGKTSALMTILHYRKGDIVLFTDTGREHPNTYEFINNFEKHENIMVDRASYNFNGLTGFEAMLHKNEHKKIPNRMLRICTFELKVHTAKRYLKAKGVLRFENLIGFRADEVIRVKRHIEQFKKVTTVFPLFDGGVTKEDVNLFWTTKKYTLKTPAILGNCDLCFLKGKNAIIQILKNNPSLADKWIQGEEKSKLQFGHTYFKNTTYSQLLELSKAIKNDIPLTEVTPAFNCACTN
jgi:hypothetical protein